MLFGIRQSVVTAINDDVFDLNQKDFADKRSYDVQTASKGTNHF